MKRDREIHVELNEVDVDAFRVINRPAWGGLLVDIFHNAKYHYRYPGIDNKHMAIN